MAALRGRNDNEGMTDFLILIGVATGFIGLVGGVLWGIAAMTGGSGREELPRR